MTIIQKAGNFKKKKKKKKFLKILKEAFPIPYTKSKKRKQT